MADEPQEHPFVPPVEGGDYNIFPATLEDDPNVFFHGTTAAARESIIRDGFKPNPPLKRSTFTHKSNTALAHTCGKHGGVDRCVLAVRVADVNAPGIDSSEPFGIYIHVNGPQPTVIRFCLIPASY
jgi:hypothetical protein